MIRLGQRYADAVAYAASVHAEQGRKGTEVPYIAHLLAVSSLVLEAGGDEDLAIAALLHDAAEDHGGLARLADIQDRFGVRVRRVVEECSDSLDEQEDRKDSWERRKREHLTRLPNASQDTLIVWTADKVHNARSLITDIAREGDAAFGKFHAAPDRLLWYYKANLALVTERGVTEALVVPLELAVTQLETLMSV